MEGLPELRGEISVGSGAPRPPRAHPTTLARRVPAPQTAAGRSDSRCGALTRRRTCLTRHSTRAGWTVAHNACPACVTRHGGSRPRPMTRYAGSRRPTPAPRHLTRGADRTPRPRLAAPGSHRPAGFPPSTPPLGRTGCRLVHPHPANQPSRPRPAASSDLDMPQPRLRSRILASRRRSPFSASPVPTNETTQGVGLRRLTPAPCGRRLREWSAAPWISYPAR